jgi:hypothetical protein
MTESARAVKHGTLSNGSTISVDLRPGAFDPAGATRVQLSLNYTRVHVPGIPSPPSFTGSAAASLDYPRTIAAGTRLTLHKAEAAALIAAGGATLST